MLGDILKGWRSNTLYPAANLQLPPCQQHAGSCSFVPTGQPQFGGSCCIVLETTCIAHLPQPLLFLFLLLDLFACFLYVPVWLADSCGDNREIQIFPLRHCDLSLSRQQKLQQTHNVSPAVQLRGLVCRARMSDIITQGQ